MIFDLWDTIADWDVEGFAAVQDRIARRLGRDPDEFAAAWTERGLDRSTAHSLEDCLREAGADDRSLPELVAWRHDAVRTALVARPGAVETLHELRRRGLRLGMISVCTEEVPAVWDKSPFAGLFDSTVFSCTVGLRKPDPRIYRLCLDELDLGAGDALFVGDGANDELGGAERVGMKAALIHRPGQEPMWPEAQTWEGPRVTSIPEVLDLC